MHTRYYFVVSLSLTFLNKEVLNGFKAPLFMTLFQFIIALILIKLIGIGGTCVCHSHSACPPLPLPPHVTLLQLPPFNRLLPGLHFFLRDIYPHTQPGLCLCSHGERALFLRAFSTADATTRHSSKIKTLDP